MNFYISDSIDKVNIKDENTEFSDDLIQFIYKLNKQTPLNMDKLCKLDPYDDIEISKDDLLDIIKVCNYILDESLLFDYEDSDEGIQMLQNLIKIAKKAREKNMGLVSIGD